MRINKNNPKISVHIPLYLNRNDKLKMKRIIKIVKEFLKISSKTIVHIHTNKKKIPFLRNKKIKLIYHNLKNEDPLKLTWKCRNLMQSQRKKFDVFLYSEDDILFTKKNFNYWIKFKDTCIKNNYNLGFIRVEKKTNNTTVYASDISRRFVSYILISNIKFSVNDINPYCAFWIYDKQEFNKFILTKYWNFKWSGFSAFAHYYTREMSAIGWHGKNMQRYKATIIPLLKKKLNPGCFIKHLSNNHALSNHPVGFGSIEKNRILSKNLKDFSEIKKEFYFIKYIKYYLKKII